MVCDGETAIIGSRNLENEHFEFDCEQNYIDCDAIVWGDVARRSQTFFDLLWSASDVKRCQAGGLLEMQFPSGNVFERSDWDQAWRRAAGPADCQRLLQQAVERVACRCSVQLPGDAARDWRDSAIHGSDLRLLHDGRANKSRSSMQDQIIRLVDGARCAVLIESPYPALDRRTRAAISRARKRGVAVTILTNSLDSTNHVCVYAAYQNQKRSLLREGVVLREYCGREILHAKMMIVDDGVCLLGSHNFDARSDYLNLELCIVACDAAAVAAVREHLQNRLSRSTRIDADSWILPVGGDAPLHKRVGLTLQRLVVELYRGLL
jgi:putative cardiolipin synthase